MISQKCISIFAEFCLLITCLLI